MATFKDAVEVYKYVGGIFESALDDPAIGARLRESGVILQIVYTDPDSVITVDLPQGKVYTGDTDLTPNVRLFMTADTGNRFWLGKVNLAVAMAKGQVRAKGPVAKVMKLIPVAKGLFPRYEEMLRQDDRQDLLNA